jgi:hypothetical protein
MVISPLRVSLITWGEYMIRVILAFLALVGPVVMAIFINWSAQVEIVVLQRRLTLWSMVDFDECQYLPLSNG